MNEAPGISPTWIAVDWGTSNLRVWAMGREGPLAARDSDAGMSSLVRDAFEDALLSLIGDWLGDAPMTVIACGMVGSREGWVEARYATAPALPQGEPVRAPVRDARLSVHVLPGVKQDSPADVMRGEETQIAGLIATNPRFDGVVCLPGTHTKWVRVSAGEICHFRTLMTGELFALLSGQSVLRHSLRSPGWEAKAFDTAVEDTLTRPDALAAELFGIRARGLVEGMDPPAARARLSGLLVGAELAATRPYWLGQDVALIGAAELSHTYAAALHLVGLSPALHDATEMTLAGLTAAHTKLKETA
ncbi:MAG: 2-dehydro-3-deoxygalactonokinase [Pseudomonadota bacterium]